MMQQAKRHLAERIATGGLRAATPKRRLPSSVRGCLPNGASTGTARGMAALASSSRRHRQLARRLLVSATSMMSGQQQSAFWARLALRELVQSRAGRRVAGGCAGPMRGVSQGSHRSGAGVGQPSGPVLDGRQPINYISAAANPSASRTSRKVLSLAGPPHGQRSCEVRTADARARSAEGCAQQAMMAKLRPRHVAPAGRTARTSRRSCRVSADGREPEAVHGCAGASREARASRPTVVGRFRCQVGQRQPRHRLLKRNATAYRNADARRTRRR